MNSCFIYCRVSTEEQADKGYSLDAQEKLCREFAERNGYRIADVFRDEGKSATSLDRPALQEMLSRCSKEGSTAAVIVQETDRLARNTKDHLTIKAVLKKADTKLISVAQPMLDDSPEGMMIDTILASVNQFQSDLNGRKTSRGLRERFDQGLWPGWAPLGYLNAEVTDATNGKAKRVVQRDPDRWNLVRSGFELYLTGDYSVRELCDILYNKGLRSRSGAKVPRSVMRSTLRNPFYAGIMVWNGVERSGSHEAMIGLGEHRRILEIMAAHNSHACRRRRHQFLLRGFAYCNICGRRYTADWRITNRHYAYYHCANDGQHSNRNQNVAAADLERAVEEQFRRIQLNEEWSQRIVDRLESEHSKRQEALESSKQALVAQKKNIEIKRDKAEEKLLEGVLSNDDYLRLRTKFAQELLMVEAQIARLTGVKGLDTEVVTEVLRLSRGIYGAYKEADYTLKRQYLALFWDRLVVQDRQIIAAVPARVIRQLQSVEGVGIRTNWDPQPTLIPILEDAAYMAEVKDLLEQIHKSSRSSADAK